MKRWSARLMRWSTTMGEWPNEGWLLDMATSPTTMRTSTTSCLYSGSGILFSLDSSSSANLSSPGVIWCVCAGVGVGVLFQQHDHSENFKSYYIRTVTHIYTHIQYSTYVTYLLNGGMLRKLWFSCTCKVNTLTLRDRKSTMMYTHSTHCQTLTLSRMCQTLE